MRIAVVAGYAPSLVNFRGELLASLVQAGHAVYTFAPDADATTRAALAAIGVFYEDIPLQRNGTNPRTDLHTCLHLARRFRALQPDVVFTYTVKPVVWGTLAAQLAGVPRRVAMVTGLGHAFIPSNDQRSHVARIVRGLYAVALRAASCVIFHNEDDRTLFLHDRLVPNDGRAVVVPGSGVDLRRFAHVPPPPTDNGAPIRFLLIARLLAEKGVREFVDAAKVVKATYPHAEFRLVGPLDSNPSGITEEEVQQWKKSGVVDVVGPVTDVRGELAACHVYVLPSYREGLPRTNLEAMAIGRPLITTDAPGCRQTVWPDNGVLVPPRDAHAVADACRAFLEHPERIAPMGAASRAHVEARFALTPINAAMRRWILGTTPEDP